MNICMYESVVLLYIVRKYHGKVNSRFETCFCIFGNYVATTFRHPQSHKLKDHVAWPHLPLLEHPESPAQVKGQC